MLDLLEWTGSICGLIGTFLLAANLALISFSIGIDRYGLLLQQVGFTATSLLGLYRSGLIARP